MMLDACSKATCCCPTCGTVISLDGIYLPPMLRRILNLVVRHGQIMPDILWDAIWGSDPNGGPTNLHTLNVHINRLNKRLQPYGRAVKRSKAKAWGAPYRLVRIAEAAP